jgi:hypothetical protein
MSVAQVLKVSGMTMGARPPEVQKMGDAIKAMDGFEHMYLLGNSEGGVLCIQVWRDRAALEAKSKQMDLEGNDATLASLGITGTETVYDTFTEL